MLNTVRSTSVFALSALLALVLAAIFSGTASADGIAGRAWYDEDKDGIQDPGEAGIEGVMVEIFLSDGTPIKAQLTDANGEYGFILGNNTFYLVFEAPPDHVFSPKDVGGDDTLDSDADSSGKTDNITLGPWPNNAKHDVDAGMYEEEQPPPPASIGDFVWEDLETEPDGIQDDGEPGIPGVTVELYDCEGSLVGTTTTDANGYYEFTGLEPGDYKVKFVLLSGYSFSPQNQGTDDAVDSDADQATGEAACTTLEPDEHDMTWDAGMYQLGPPAGGFGTPGFWKAKQHYDDWPVDEIEIGGVTYSKDDAIDWMKKPTKGDKTITMFAALVAAKLNVASGHDDSCIADTIAAADDWMAEYGPVGSDVDDWHSGESLYKELDKYNNGQLCAP